MKDFRNYILPILIAIVLLVTTTVVLAVKFSVAGAVIFFVGSLSCFTFTLWHVLGPVTK